MSKTHRNRPKSPDRYMLDIQQTGDPQGNLRDFDEWVHKPNPIFDIDLDTPEMDALTRALESCDALLLEI